MDGEDDWLVRAADRELAAVNQDFDAISFERFEGDSDNDSYGSLSEGLNWDWRDAVIVDIPQSYNERRGLSSRISVNSDCTVATIQHSPISRGSSNGSPLSLLEQAASSCAKNLAFYQLESAYRCVNMLKRNRLFPYTQDIENVPLSDTLPDTLFLKIIKYCFPTNLEDVRLYSVLASGKPDNFNQGKSLYGQGNVTDVVQIGYLISASVTDDCYSQVTRAMQTVVYRVSIKVDRCRIIYTKCSCEDPSSWCSHVCALVNFRLKEPHRVQYRVTVWDAINELDVQRLKKFAQYLINELPRQHLPMAQRLLDQLSDPKSEINNSCGAPDPTDGGHDPIALMSYNERILHDMIRRQLQCFCLKQTQAHGIDEMNSPKNSTAQEFQRHLQPLANLDPPAMHNLVFMVKNMLMRRDPNAISLIRVLTEECLANRLVLLYWYCSKLIQSGRWQMGSDDNQSRQLNIGQLCDELVGLWRRVALNPSVDREYRDQLFAHLQRYHRLAADRIFKIIKSAAAAEDSMVGNVISNIMNQQGEPLSPANARFTMECFPGFHSAMKICEAMRNMEIKGIPVEPCYGWIKWPEHTIDLLPEQLPQSPKKKTKKKHRRHGDRRNSRRSSRDHRNNSRNRDRGNRRRNRREIESSESGQESEQDEIQDLFPHEDVSDVLAQCYTQMDPFETRFAQCEAAAAHGYHEQASKMALDLMKSLIAHVEEAPHYDQCLPSTSSSTPSINSDCSNPNFELIQIRTSSRIDTMEKSVLIANVLARDKDRNNQSRLFQFIVKIILCSKFPMSSKYAQVKEHYLEMELLKILQTIEIHEMEVQLMRECSHKIRDIIMSDGIPPIGLAKFIFEELTYSTYVVKFDQVNQPHYRSSPARNGRTPEDDEIALEAAVNAVGARVNWVDAEYPMLCEAVRYMKGHLAISLLVSFKDDKEKLGIILDRLLDPRIHQLYKKSFTNAVYFLKEETLPRTAGLRRKYFPGQRPTYPYVSCPKKDDEESEPVEEFPNRDEEEEELRKMMSATMLNSVRQQESARKQMVQEAGKRTNIIHAKGKRFKPRTFASSTDAYSNFMSDLGKRVLSVAGGNPSSLFAVHHHPSGPHRNLHICSLLISLYGLGVSNKGNKSRWFQRHYCAEVSWIQQQIPEIGQQAYDIIREIYWEFHFTPAEMATLSDKTIQTQHPQAPHQAALLSLAILPYAHTLQHQEIKSAINKCKDDSSDTLEKACDSILNCYDTTGDIPVDILFIVARHYEDLYKEKELNKQPSNRKASANGPSASLQHMNSYPGAPNVYMPGQYQNPYVYHHQYPTSPVYNPHVPGFPPVGNFYPARPQDMDNGSATQPGLHQSHSAPTLCQSNGTTSSSRIFCSRLVKAYTAGIKALGAFQKMNAEQPKTQFTRPFQFQGDVEWLCDLVLMNLGVETSFEFFEHVHATILCPYTLFNLVVKCYQLNLQCNLQGIQLPPKKMYVPMAGNQQTSAQSGNRMLNIQSLIQAPPPKISKTRHALNYSTLADKPFHPVTIDLLEKCFDQIARALHIRLSFATFTDLDRLEAERLFQTFIQFKSLIPSNQNQTSHNIIEQEFMGHIMRAKSYRAMARREAMNVTDPVVKALLLRYPPFPTMNPYNTNSHHSSYY